MGTQNDPSHQQQTNPFGNYNGANIGAPSQASPSQSENQSHFIQTPPTPTLPKGGGAIQGIGEKFAANPANGTGSFSVPIAISPGRSGFGPNLSLNYSSGLGNSPFGYGWQLSLPEITRKTEKGLPRYLDKTESDKFILSDTEDLVPLLNNDGSRFVDESDPAFEIHRYRPRVEGPFARIERWTRKSDGDVHWRSYSTGNLLTVYGRDSKSRIADPENPTRIFRWLISEMRDDRGNAVLYEYVADNGDGVKLDSLAERNRGDKEDPQRTANRYLKRIHYGNETTLLIAGQRPKFLTDSHTSATHFLFVIVFDYGEHDVVVPTPHDGSEWDFRNDPFSTYRPGFELRTTRICKRVLMFHHFPSEAGVGNDCLVASTDFTYSHDEEPQRSENPRYSYLKLVTQKGYKRDGAAGYSSRSMPPVEFSYSEPTLQEQVEQVPADSLGNLPVGVDGTTYQFTDLFGEGTPGILTEQGQGWFYKRNLSPLHASSKEPHFARVEFSPTERIVKRPAAQFAEGAQLMDMAGNGEPDLVTFSGETPGFYQHDGKQGWEPFKPFLSLPNRDFNDENLKFIDLNGDGRRDLLITENSAFVWYESLGEEGFGPAEQIAYALNEELGPKLVFADGTESIHLADLSGDGLTDLVRIRNGEVCYWPNLGYGRFGQKVAMDNAPSFDNPDQFDQDRIRLSDIDGTGTTDIIYLHRDGVHIYFNHSGNGWGDAEPLEVHPQVNDLLSITTADLLGNSTACLVWSSSLPQDQNQPMRYVNLMGGQKPHLMIKSENNMGAETHFHYAPSTKFYLADKKVGKPWLTKLPFPVHVIERIEHFDHVAISKLVTRYSYHHGYFDGEEREFRGFAYVEQFDAEFFSGDKGKGMFPFSLGNVDEELILPPVHTKTWFHTGAWLERRRLENELAKEYYSLDPNAPTLKDTVFPNGLSVEEEREAARAFRNKMLRQEIYALDGTPESIHPYTVSESNYNIRLLQNRTEDTHAVFFTHSLETVQLYYERNPIDPRQQHELILEVDDFGKVTQSASMAYPRRAPVQPEQGKIWATVSEASVSNRPDETDWYRVGDAFEEATYELTGLVVPGVGLLREQDVRRAIARATEIEFEATATGTTLEKRLIERQRTLYYRDDLSGPLSPGQIESLAIEFETYRQAFSPGLITQVFGTNVNDTILQDEGGYLKQDEVWWAPSGQEIFDPDHFYLPVEAVDQFGAKYFTRYDDYHLLVLESEDPLGNRVTAGLRNTAETITQNGNDYRTLSPALITDPNRNRTSVEFDALGMVVKAAIMGKEGVGEGDNLADPTTKISYDPNRWYRTKEHPSPLPVFVKAEAREQHGSANLRWQISYLYSDGSGREAMKKLQAEPGNVPVLSADGTLLRNPDGSPQTRHEANRWVGSGRTVFDNKGNPVKQYEPFFSATFEYENEKELVEWGVTPILRYDPIGRLILTDLPNGSHTKVVFDTWQQETWDENDTIVGTPWLTRMQAGTAEQQRAAILALAHANTPEVAHLDTLGRAFLTIADNGALGQHETRVELDIVGNQHVVTDARGNQALTQVFDLLDRTLTANSPDGGLSSTLTDCVDKPIRTWDPRGHLLRSVYDEAQRRTHLFLRKGSSAEKLVERSVYGEVHPQATMFNLRGQGYALFDGAGVVTNEHYDFSGNLIESTRQLAQEYKITPDWSPLASLQAVVEIETFASPLLEPDTITTKVTYDALTRIVSSITPDDSETRYLYNEAGLLNKVDVRVRGASSWTNITSNIDYNAHGEPTQFQQSNGSSTIYKYNTETFRLIQKRTTRSSGNAVLQDLVYLHDPVGNIVSVIDSVSFSNAGVSANGLYEYNALYQLTLAEGREHPGQQPTEIAPNLLRVDHPNDMQGLRRYREQYAYDEVGNILRIGHQPLGPGGAGRTRSYEYATDSNRLLRTSAPGDAPGMLSASYDYDDAGNMIMMPHLSTMRWQHADQLQATSKQVVSSGTPETTYYTYDASGIRVRKITERQATAGSTPTRKNERCYLGGMERYLEYEGDGVTTRLERETLDVTDDRKRIALIETIVKDSGVGRLTPSSRFRFQIDNHLGSSAIELDKNGKLITYEEYLPYGGTSFHAARSATEVSAKRYKYSGKERDEETGLDYCNARYYCSWLGRWASVDPAGLFDGPNPYQYAQCNPVRYNDPSGLQSHEAENDPNNPQNPAYKTYEDYAAGAEGPYREEALQMRWAAEQGGSDEMLGDEYVWEVYQEEYTEYVEETATVKKQNRGTAIMSGTLAISGAMVLDDATVIGVADDPAIPFVLVGGLAIGAVAWVFSSSSTKTITRVVPQTRTRTRRRRRRQKATYVTYTRFNVFTGETYSGRASGYGAPDQILSMAQASPRHVILTAEGFGRTRLSTSQQGTRPVSTRHSDPAYRAMRGREQQLIDSFGGARSWGRGAGGPHITIPGAITTARNTIRGVGPTNPLGRAYHNAATRAFGQIAPFTGNNPARNVP